MRGGTGRLPGRDDERDPGSYKFLLYLSPDVYMEAGRFSSRPGQASRPASHINSPQVKVLQNKFTLLHADFSKIVLKYSNEVHLLRYLTPLVIPYTSIKAK